MTVNIKNINAIAAQYGLRLVKDWSCFNWRPTTADRTVFSVSASVSGTVITDRSWAEWMAELDNIVARIADRKAVA